MPDFGCGEKERSRVADLTGAAPCRGPRSASVHEACQRGAEGLRQLELVQRNPRGLLELRADLGFRPAASLILPPIDIKRIRGLVLNRGELDR